MKAYPTDKIYAMRQLEIYFLKWALHAMPVIKQHFSMEAPSVEWNVSISLFYDRWKSFLGCFVVKISLCLDKATCV